VRVKAIRELTLLITPNYKGVSPPYNPQKSKEHLQNQKKTNATEEGKRLPQYKGERIPPCKPLLFLPSPSKGEG